MSGPSTRIVSLTVTEKGYCHDPASGTLNEAHPDIRADLATPDQPRTAPGLIVAALKARRAAGLKPFTVLCCDNLPANGRTVRRVIARFAALSDPGLGAYVEDEVAFPSTMVDRIVPATTDADRVEVNTALGLDDRWPVMTEPFLQWVIEDHFPQGRPDWEIAGAEFASDVAPYELMKLRMLNGSHSMLAYCGTLAGLQHVADGAHDPDFAALLHRYWAMVGATLPGGAGLDPSAYARRLQERYENRAIRHRLVQIAMDGSQKLPQRLLNTLRELRQKGAPFDAIALTLAAFTEFMTGRDQGGAPYPVNDPLAALFTARAGEAGSAPEELVPAILGIEAVFGDLAGDSTLVRAVITYLQRIRADGARAAVRAILA
jgi:fructuronate reductase